MNIFDCIFGRRSVRRFRSDPIDDKFIGLILHAATHAPSAGNMQEWHFVVIKDEKKRKELADAAFNQSFIAEAPVSIVVAADLEKVSLKYGKRGENLYALQDTANATTIIMLAAHELGLGTCWIGSFDEDRVSHIAELPENFRPVAVIPLGYPAEKPKMPSRIPFENLTSFNGYGKSFDIAEAVKPEPGKETRIKPIGNVIEDLIERGKERIGKPKVELETLEGGEPFSYTNKKGRTYWLHKKDMFFFSKNPRGSVNLPEDMEVFETKRTGLPMIKKKK